MSGGALDYFFCKFDDHIEDFDDRELDDLVKDMAKLFHDREWYLSGDTSIGDWREARDNFKKKWFAADKREARIENYLRDITEKIKDEFGIGTRYCMTCGYWDREPDAIYGRCRIHPIRTREKDDCSDYTPKDDEQIKFEHG